MCNALNEYDDETLFNRVKKSDERAFEVLYDRYWKRLYAFVFNRIRTKEISEEIVQEVFIKFWEQRKTISISTSFSGYIFTSIKFKMLNTIRAGNIRSDYLVNFRRTMENRYDHSLEENMNVDEMQKIVNERLKDLSPRYQTIYRMSREQDIPNQDIANALYVSKKTIENNMVEILKHLRASLSEFMMNG